MRHQPFTDFFLFDRLKKYRNALRARSARPKRKERMPPDFPAASARQSNVSSVVRAFRRALRERAGRNNRHRHDRHHGDHDRQRELSCAHFCSHFGGHRALAPVVRTGIAAIAIATAIAASTNFLVVFIVSTSLLSKRRSVGFVAELTCSDTYRGIAPARRWSGPASPPPPRRSA